MRSKMKNLIETSKRVLLNESLKPGSGNIKLDIDWTGTNGRSGMDWKTVARFMKQIYGVTIKKTGSSTADISGKKSNVYKYLSGDHYMMDPADIEDLYPDLFK